MAFDPTLPIENTEIDAAQMRSQLQGLKTLIDAILTINSVQVDSVSVLNPGESASASVSVSGGTLHFSFAIPRGDTGAQGQQGPPFAQALVDGVNTLNPGEAAQVQVGFDGTNVHFIFFIPRGADGGTGPPGEVTASQLSSAIANTSSNSNEVPTLDTPFANNPPTLADMEVLRAKLNDLILALRRV